MTDDQGRKTRAIVLVLGQESMKIRPATVTDHRVIKRIVKQAQINPTDLDWRRFVVAEEEDNILGVGQIKSHRDGSRELASIAVIPERQHQGIGGEIIQTLLNKDEGHLYLMCREELEPYYKRFGFQRQSPKDSTPYFRRMHRIVNAFLSQKLGVEIIIMKRDSS